MAGFCDRCTREDVYRETGKGGCEILMRTMYLNPGDEGYPPEWKFDDNGEPTCTAFHSVVEFDPISLGC